MSLEAGPPARPSGPTTAVPRPREPHQAAAPVMDDSEIRELCQEHATPLFRYVLGLTARDSYVAEDVVQEVLLRAWQNSATLAGRRGSIRPWLFTVARNLVVDRHRAKQARPAEVGDESLAMNRPIPDDLDDILTSWGVQDALAALNLNHRQILVELYFRGRSVAEASAELGIPPGTVKSRTYYAMRALRVALQERGLAPHEDDRGSSTQAALRR